MDYEKPEFEVVDCDDDVIVTSGGGSGTGGSVPDTNVPG